MLKEIMVILMFICYIDNKDYRNRDLIMRKQPIQAGLNEHAGAESRTENLWETFLKDLWKASF